MAVQMYIVLLFLRAISANGDAPNEVHRPLTNATNATSGNTLPDKIPSPTLLIPHVPARTNNPLDALLDEEEFGITTTSSYDISSDLEGSTHPGVMEEDKNTIIARWRKPLAEEKLIKDPFYFGCCQNSTNVGCAGVCPETCEYRSKYCVPLCGPPCRCKRGYVYHIPDKACRLRSECNKSLVQSKFGVYRVFL
ncbi:uncharacterized protein [Drosophila bipectinata]|uniref:uncharacterized protein n=1 Tax=Drosophila bipectinata TaxID=42026 RepID=UPI001C8A7F25|nr:uncharacterized protein LOC108133072 [Drosophila bipectinata]